MSDDEAPGNPPYWMIEGEAPLSPPFWVIEDSDEDEAVRRMLRRRFGATMDRLADGLERADPMEVVYPGNPNEYSDVVLEIVALLAPVNGDLDRLTDAELGGIVNEGLARRFGEHPDPDRVDQAVQFIRG